MPAATCIRCFAVFSSDDARPGAAPICPPCASALSAAQPTLEVPTVPAPAPRWSTRLPRLSRPVLIGAGVALALIAAACAAAAARWFML